MIKYWVVSMTREHGHSEWHLTSTVTENRKWWNITDTSLVGKKKKHVLHQVLHISLLCSCALNCEIFQIGAFLLRLILSLHQVYQGYHKLCFAFINKVIRHFSLCTIHNNLYITGIASDGVILRLHSCIWRQLYFKLQLSICPDQHFVIVS